MAAFFTAEQIELLSASVVRCDFLFKFEFADAPIYAWNGNTDLESGGNTYQALKGYARLDGLGLGGQGTVSESVTLGLSGLPLPPDFLAQVLAETPQAVQRLLTISLQLFNADWQVVGSPIPLFWGFMQPPEVTRTEMQGTEGAVQSVSITAENIFFGRSMPPNGRFTDTDQRRRSPTDKFFGFMMSLKSKKITYPDY